MAATVEHVGHGSCHDPKQSLTTLTQIHEINSSRSRTPFLSRTAANRSARFAGAILIAIGLFVGRLASGQSPAPTETAPAAESATQLEYNVKAAFLYSFGRYVEWPENQFKDKEAPFVIGICGENPFGKTLDLIAAKRTIQGRRIEIRKVDPAKEFAGCHMIFITSSIDAEEQKKIIEKSKGTPLLTIGEIPRFAEIGGDVNFFLEGDRVRFEINVDTLRGKKLLIDAKLLSLGKKLSSTMNSGRGMRNRR
jgi:hypothetical protein